MSLFNNFFVPMQDEKVIAHLWPHPFIFFKIFASYFLMLLIPVVFYFAIGLTAPTILDNTIWFQILSVVCFTYYLVILMMVFSIWMDTFLDFWTLTDRRIISREQNGLFNRTVSELELYRVQDVSVEQKGFLATMLNFGDLYIQSAGEQERFSFKNVGEPVKISRLIQRLDQDAKKEHLNQP